MVFFTNSACYHIYMSQFDDSLTNARITELHHSEEERLVEALAPKYGLPYTNLQQRTLDIEALRLIPESESRNAELALFARTNERVSVAVRNPHNPDFPITLKKLEGMELLPSIYLISLQSVMHAWERYHDI